ncbi:hypothetical protein [Tolypothrix sp. VBCCA 56010]|uniref:hypothetical protein n=1 Tax=Tolypothrix sp. VBCCA 56010 TaxID=3137731 RepID=UPI003D7ECFCD
MAKTLTIKLPDDLEHQLTIQAEQLNLSLEELVLQSLTQSAKQTNSLEADPILPLIGTLKFENYDLGENHNNYISETWQQ